MSRSNRLEAVERKIGYLLAEKEDLGPEIAKAEGLVAKLPEMRNRLTQIDTLIESAAFFVKDDHPDWSPDHIKPIRKWVHKNPIKLGELTRGALSLLRDAETPMTSREVASALLEGNGHANPTGAEVDMVANAVQVAFNKRRGTSIEADGGWPERWWALHPSFSRVAD